MFVSRVSDGPSVRALQEGFGAGIWQEAGQGSDDSFRREDRLFRLHRPWQDGQSLLHQVQHH